MRNSQKESATIRPYVNWRFPPDLGRRSLGYFVLQPCRIPQILGKTAVKLLPRIKVGSLEFCMRTERQQSLLRKPYEPWISLVRQLVEALSKQILLQIVRTFLSVRSP